MKKQTDYVKASLTLNMALGVAIAGLETVLLAFEEANRFETRMALIVMMLAIAGTVSSALLGRTMSHLRNKATKDSLTGLINRDSFMSQLERSLKDTTGQVALLFIDLNKFKAVNDTLGHLAGDELLKQSSTRLLEVLPQRCVLGRLGGDEFGVIVNRATERDIEYLARTISELFYQPYDLNSGNKVEVGVAIGVAIFPDQAKTVSDLTRFADLAMYEAKRTAQPFVMFSHRMSQSSEDELFMSSSLRTAIERNQLLIEYQPKLELKTNTVVGAEALIRWDHPILGRVMPDKFIPVAEQRGLINQITDWVVTTALRDLHVIRNAGVLLKNISVNISPFSVIHGNLLVSISKSLSAENVDPNSLVIEVTETSIQHRSQELIKILVCLDMVGIGISIDDFGTGQSSLLYLKYLPTTEIKIDRSFVRNICVSPQDYAITKSIISLAHDIGCTVCAEGVETEEMRKALEELGCDTIQGYLIAKPCPVDKFIKNLTTPEE